MKTIVGDLWSQKGLLLIPTNLTIKKNGDAVLGRGVASQAVEKYPHLPRIYGDFLSHAMRMDGTFVLSGVLFTEEHLILCPVKYHWSEKANLDLIEPALHTISMLVKKEEKVFLPLIGCGYGELQEKFMRPFLEQKLDDRFTLVLKNQTVVEKYKHSFQPGARQDRSEIHK